jgi:hypothetical protein
MMTVRAVEKGTGRVRTGRIGGGSGSGGVAPAFQADFTALSALSAGLSLSRATAGTYFDASGVLQMAAIDAPRFDHAWNGSAWVPTGLLIEEQRTNLLPRSNNFTTDWTAGGSTATQNAVGIDGTTSAWTHQATAGSGVHIRYLQAAGNAANTDTSLSLYVKAGTHGLYFLNYQGGPSQDWCIAIFNLNTGAVTQTAVGSAGGSVTGTSMIALGGGLYRIVLVGQVATAGTGYLTHGLAGAATGNTFDSFGQPSFTATGSETVIIQDAQVETGPFPTSYIPTTTAAVTRSEDIAQLTGTALTTLQGSAFSLIAEVDGVPNVDGQVVTDGTAALLARPGGSTTNIKTQTTGSDLVASGGTNSILTTFRAATAFNATGGSLVVNGGTVSTSSDTAITISAVRIGSRTDGYSIDSHFRSIAIYSSRLSDADLQAKSVVGAAF